MEALTPESAREAELPLNPFHRHQVVSAMLKDLEIVGDTMIVHNPHDPVKIGPERRAIIGRTISPLLGRRALIKTAVALQVLDRLEGEQDGEDF